MVMRRMGGRPLILHTLASLTDLDLTRLVVVLGARMTMVAEAVRPLAATSHSSSHQFAEIAFSKTLFAQIRRLIDRLRPAPLPP